MMHHSFLVRFFDPRQGARVGMQIGEGAKVIVVAPAEEA